MKRLGTIAVAAALAALFSGGAGPAPASDGADGTGPENLILIVDASGSMWGQIGGENKIVIARRVFSDLIDGLPDDQRIGVIAYGHRREGDCEDIELVAPLGGLDREKLSGSIDALNPKGKTPITDSLKRAFEIVESSGKSATVVLVSDGLETCGGDPCALVRAAKERGVSFVMHVVGFGISDDDVSQLECAAQAGEGMFLSAEDADALGAALDTAVALPTEAAQTALTVKVIANGSLHDATVEIIDPETRSEISTARTYVSPETNPRRVALPPGEYVLEVTAVGIRGDVGRSETITIEEGKILEREYDFSTGRIVVGVTRNGEPGDATVRVTMPGTKRTIATSRTYESASKNPATITITAGTYDVSVKSVDIEGAKPHTFEALKVEPNATVVRSHAFESSELRIGAKRGGTLVDVVVQIVDPESGSRIAQGRTYTKATSNPNDFVVAPGSYEVRIREVGGGATATEKVEAKSGESFEKVFELAEPSE